MTRTAYPGLAALTRVAAGISTLAALNLAAPIHAQDGTHTRGVLGAGVSFAGAGPATSSGPGLSGHIGLRHQRGDYVFAARAGVNGGGTADGTAFDTQFVVRDRFDEVALLVGYAVHRSERSQIVLSAGLAAVSGERVVSGDGDGTRIEAFDTRIGFPLQLALAAPGPGSGLGLVVHANLNPEEVFGAVTATYLIGFDRKR